MESREAASGRLSELLDYEPPLSQRTDAANSITPSLAMVLTADSCRLVALASVAEAQAHSPRLRAILEGSRRQIEAGAGIRHEDFWREMEEKPSPKPRKPKRKAP